MAREPWAWWRSLGSPATVCAPMVDQSERAFRLLVRRHGCDLCYTPMLHADLVVRDAAYRRDHVPDAACAEDRPLIAQLGGGDPATLAAAAREIAARGGCDAIDVNLGCPQACARRGGYGAFLDDDGAARAVRAVAEASPLPATAKIRCRAAGDAEGLDVDVAATVALAERLVAAGAAAVSEDTVLRDGGNAVEGPENGLQQRPWQGRQVVVVQRRLQCHGEHLPPRRVERLYRKLQEKGAEAEERRRGEHAAAPADSTSTSLIRRRRRRRRR